MTVVQKASRHFSSCVHLSTINYSYDILLSARTHTQSSDNEIAINKTSYLYIKTYSEYVIVAWHVIS